MLWTDDTGVLFRSKLEGRFEEGGDNMAEVACEALWPVVPAKSHTVAKPEPGQCSSDQICIQIRVVFYVGGAVDYCSMPGLWSKLSAKSATCAVK